MSKNSSKIAYAAVAVLGETFAAAFARRGAERRPLKIGIARDLLERGVDLDVIRAGLGSYCRSYGYLSAMKAGASRVDLDGSVAGIVTAEEAASAQERLAELKPAPAAAKPKAAAKAKPSASRKPLPRPRSPRPGQGFRFRGARRALKRFRPRPGHRVQSSSTRRLAAALLGFLVFTQSGERPER